MGLLLDDARLQGGAIKGLVAAAQLYAQAARTRLDNYSSAIATAEGWRETEHRIRRRARPHCRP